MKSKNVTINDDEHGVCFYMEGVENRVNGKNYQFWAIFGILKV